MTCVAAVVHEGSVWMGSDSCGVAGTDLSVRKDPKVFIKDGFIIGFTTSFRMGQLLMYNLNIPEMDGLPPFKYMVTKFVDAVRECLSEGGFQKKEAEREEGGTFMVGFNGNLFTIESDYQVAESQNSYDACGCGASIALGALYATQGTFPPDHRIRLALKASEEFSAGVRGPFTLMHLPRAQSPVPVKE